MVWDRTHTPPRTPYFCEVCDYCKPGFLLRVIMFVAALPTTASPSASGIMEHAENTDCQLQL